MTLGEYRQGDQVLPILLKNNQLDSFRINDLRTLPVFGTGNETTSLEQVVSEFDFQYRFSNVKDYNRQNATRVAGPMRFPLSTRYGRKYSKR